MPRAKADERVGFYTSSTAADELGLTRYLIKARISDGTLPPPSQTTDSGVILFDQEWMDIARQRVASKPQTVRRRGRRRRLAIPSPEDVLGYRPGEARKLPTWSDMVSYFERLASASDRVEVETLGTSTEGRPYVVVAVSAPGNLAPEARDRNRELLGMLWDSRGHDRAEIEAALQEARSVGVILATQHSNEIGAALMTMDLAHELASATDRSTRELLDETVVLMVPSHNPDGIDMIHEWYTRWRGTKYEGIDLPWLYHPYVGHDNNRDWFMLTQKETGLYVDLHNREHPQAVFDMHQMGRKGARFMVPPFIDPLDPNQDPVIQQGFAALGTHIAQRLTAAGKQGVVTHAIFDNYSPSLAYGNYHGSVDLLSEAASAKLATPIEIKEDEISDEHGFDATRRAWNHPMPWKGGTWTLREIVEYDKIAARAFIEHLGRNRAQWLQDYRDITSRVVNRDEKPFGWVMPPEQRDPAAASELLDILDRGLVDVEEAMVEFEADGIAFPAGSRVVRVQQPAGLFAKTLLEKQDYPNLVKYKGGPPQPPYDIAGHTLPLQMGIYTVEIRTPIADDASFRRLERADLWPKQPSIKGNRNVRAWSIDGGSNGAIAMVSRLHQADVPIRRAVEPVAEAGIDSGDWIVAAEDVTPANMQSLADSTRAVVSAVAWSGDVEVVREAAPRIGIYRPHTASMDEGWARWLLDHYRMSFTSLSTADLRQGGLRDRFDTILAPEMTRQDLLDGRQEKNQYGDPWPPEVTGGLGEPGLHQLRAFVQAGGTVVAIDHAAGAIAEQFALPVRQPLAGVPDTEFFCPGSLLRTVVDQQHPLGYGALRETTVLFLSSVVFEPVGPDAKAIATYPHANPNLSGWIRGADKLHGRAALVECGYGEGKVVLFGFRPYFRAQARGTYRLFFNALNRRDRPSETLSL